MVCAPVATTTAPVVPPLPALAPEPAVAPSIWRLKRPGSPAGRRTFCTVRVVALRVLVKVQTTVWLAPAVRALFAPGATGGAVSGEGSGAPGTTGRPLSVQASVAV